jgi:hypothetical protein
MESLGMDEARRILVKSEWMKQELKHHYNTSDKMIEIVPPDAESWIDRILAGYRKRLEVSAN